MMAPMGFGMAATALGFNVGGSADLATSISVSSTRASESHYEYSFTFEYDFSTSSNPLIAGHPSDIIIGGGVDLVVNEAIKGEAMSVYKLTIFHLLINHLLFVTSCGWRTG